MKGLLTKDFYLLGNQYRSLLLILICGIGMSFGMDTFSGIVYLTMIGSIFSLSTLSYDEMENGYSYLLTFPVSRKTYAKEKYVFSFLMSVFFCLLGLIICIIVGFIKDGQLIEEIGENVITSLMMSVFLISIMLPLRLKYGSEKSKFVLFGIFGIGALIVYFLNGNNGENYSKLAEKLSQLDFKIVLAAMITFIVILCCISVAASIRIMEKKEF